MKIAVDLRSLQSGTISGVENYTLNLLERLLVMDKRNTYTLFYNGFRKMNLPDFQFINAQTVKAPIPNRLLNLGFKFNFLRLEKLIGGFDALFMPNLNTMNLKTTAKIVITVHDLSFALAPELYNFKRRFWHKFLSVKKLLRRADRILAVSNYTKLDLIRLYELNEQKISVIYPGVDEQTFYPNQSIEDLRACRNRYDLPGEYFLFLNTIEPRKNLENLIKSFERTDVRAHLVVAGKKGWKTSAIFKLLKNNLKANRVHYIGYVKEEDKPQLFKMATAVLYPSIHEGFGFQVLEAMAVGTPVIASQVASLPEIAGDVAFLVNPQNQLDLAVAMREMEKNSPLRSMLIQKGFERVKKFNWQETAKQTLAVLESL